MKQELLACPFCGHDAEHNSFERKSVDGDIEGYAVSFSCENDECPTKPAVFGLAEDVAILRDKWNTRATPAQAAGREYKKSNPQNDFNCIYLFENGREVGCLNGPQDDPLVIARAEHWISQPSRDGAGEEWQPIETAPLNEKVLGYWDGPGDMLPGLIGKTKTGGIEWAPAEFISGKNWIMPTHWRPLPKPPSGDMKSDGGEK